MPTLPPHHVEVSLHCVSPGSALLATYTESKYRVTKLLVPELYPSRLGFSRQITDLVTMVHAVATI